STHIHIFSPTLTSANLPLLFSIFHPTLCSSHNNISLQRHATIYSFSHTNQSHHLQTASGAHTSRQHCFITFIFNLHFSPSSLHLHHSIHHQEHPPHFPSRDFNYLTKAQRSCGGLTRRGRWEMPLWLLAFLERMKMIGHSGCFLHPKFTTL
ncbi:hypothetical protein VIGAN_10031500, partial [Vigna angularis var. angularis]